MPASFTLTTDRFPAGTVVGLYPKRTVIDERGPKGAVLDTATTSANLTTTFSGLAFDTEYWGAADFGGSWRKVAFRTEVDPALIAASQGDFLALQAEAAALVVAEATARANAITAVGNVVDVLREAPPNVELGEYEELRTGDDWSASFEAIRDAVGAGRAFELGARTYELDSFASLTKQRMSGQGPDATILKAKAGATRVMTLDGQWLAGIAGLTIDGRSKASDGLRIRGDVGGGATSQRHLLERVRITECDDGLLVDGAGVGTPPSDQVDKNTYLDVMIDNCNVGFRTNAINSQQQLFVGGSIDDCAKSIVLAGGSFCAIGWQSQQTVNNTGTLMEFTGANVAGVVLVDCITEGHAIGFDSTASNFWPLPSGVLVLGGVIQAVTNLALIDRAGSVVVLVGKNAQFNGGPIVLRGNDTIFDDEFCTGTFSVTLTGTNTSHRKRPGGFPNVASASTIALPAGAEAVNVTGTTNVSAITGGYAGRKVTLVFNNSLSLVYGATILLAGAVSFAATTGDTLTLIHNGALWLEVGRSVN